MIFPKWSNKIFPLLIINLFASLLFVIFVFWYWFSPKNLNVGYQPNQPVSYSHKLHVDDLGIDCRYCHNSVEKSAYAAIPPTETCMNCHKLVKTESAEIKKIAKSYASGLPIRWNKVYNLADYTYFNHSRHVAAGVSCVECHGRVDQMEKVYQVESLSMSWCLDCHRNPAPKLRPQDKITDLAWKPDDPIATGQKIIALHKIAPREDCNTCHR